MEGERDSRALKLLNHSTPPLSISISISLRASHFLYSSSGSSGFLHLRSYTIVYRAVGLFSRSSRYKRRLQAFYRPARCLFTVSMLSFRLLFRNKLERDAFLTRTYTLSRCVPDNIFSLLLYLQLSYGTHLVGIRGVNFRSDGGYIYI